MQCRFSGHLKKFMSVGQHSVNVSIICPEPFELWALLHDASEAYLQDVARPIKYAQGMEQYIIWEKKLQAVICERFGLPVEEPPEVKICDNRMMAQERRSLTKRPKRDIDVCDLLLKGDEPSVYSTWQPAKAKKMFLNRFKELTASLPNQHLYKVK